MDRTIEDEPTIEMLKTEMEHMSSIITNNNIEINNLKVTLNEVVATVNDLIKTNNRNKNEIKNNEEKINKKKETEKGKENIYTNKLLEKVDVQIQRINRENNLFQQPTFCFV